MAKVAKIGVKEGGLGEAMRDFLRSLVDKKIVEACLVPQKVPSRDSVVQALLIDSAQLATADPLAPVVPVNSAKIVSDMTKVTPSKTPIAVVLRPCELRALVELVKLKQASLDNLLLIGLDCFGTYSVVDYKERCSSGGISSEEFLKSALRSPNGLRPLCETCEHFSPENADLAIGLFGLDLQTEFLIIAQTEKGEETFGRLGLKGDEDPKGREKAISDLRSERTKKVEEMFQAMQHEIGGLEKILATLASCIGCHNCMRVCPICYCRECFFESPTLEVDYGRYITWARRKGSVRMPTDTLLFHLGRMNHMATSCVECGMCEQACPSDIPVGRMFKLVGAGVQKIFEYVPGRNLEEELPLTTFKEDELQAVGEE